MKITKKLVSLSLVVFAAVTSMQAQDTFTDSHTITIGVPEVAILDIEGGDNINLGFTAPTEAGLPIVAALANSTLWLNYSSIVELGETNKITVELNALSPGVDIEVTAAADAGLGDGTMGIPEAALTLTVAAQDIITGIGSSYTGTGINNGHQLTYTVDVTAGGGGYADFVADTDVVTVTYTIIPE